MTGQNTSSAVMQQRREAHDSLDDFPTPPWATRALCHWLSTNTEYYLSKCDCREPAANRGHMVKPLDEYFRTVDASDVHDYGAGYKVEDYLFGPSSPIDFTITNPPFRLAEQFIEKALETSSCGVAMFVRSAFLEGVGRYNRLFSRVPPSFVLQFTERVVIHKGKLSPDGSSATSYCWVIWDMLDECGKTQLDWIAPCRRELERPEDYT